MMEIFLTNGTLFYTNYLMGQLKEYWIGMWGISAIGINPSLR